MQKRRKIVTSPYKRTAEAIFGGKKAKTLNSKQESVRIPTLKLPYRTY